MSMYLIPFQDWGLALTSSARTIAVQRKVQPLIPSSDSVRTAVVPGEPGFAASAIALRRQGFQNPPGNRLAGCLAGRVRRLERSAKPVQTCQEPRGKTELQ